MFPVLVKPLSAQEFLLATLEIVVVSETHIMIFAGCRQNKTWDAG